MTARSLAEDAPMSASNSVGCCREHCAAPPLGPERAGGLLSSLLARFHRASIELRDGLTYSPAARSFLYRCRCLREVKSGRDDAQAVARSVVRLCSAARVAPTLVKMRSIENQIHQRMELLDTTKLDWKEFVPDCDRRTIATAAIIKPNVSEREKGVLFVSFGHQWVRLLGLRNLHELARSYTLVVAPSWSPPHDLVNYVFPKSYPDTVFSLISNIHDVETLPRFSKGYRVVPLYASSWVNPDVFRPLPFRDRDIDIVMVANFGKFKRHFALFKALMKMPADLRVVLIGQDQDGRGAGAIYKEATYYNVHKKITLMRNVPYQGVADALSRSRASLILSRREGSCVAVAESLFADTPVAMLEDAHVGSRAFINQSTGCLLKNGDLSGQLRDFLARSDEYSPRQWADRNISCHRSTAVLNDAIRDHLLGSGQEWTQDIVPLCWCPDPRLVFPEDESRMQAARDDFERRFGLAIGRG